MKWIKDNLVLVAGIALPVLLVAGFFLLSKAPAVLTDPPEYDFLLVAYRYDHQHPRDFNLSFDVRDRKLQGKVTPAKEGQSTPSRQYAGIFRYNAADNSFDEVAYELPEGIDGLEEPLFFLVEETAHLDLDKRKKSPDGYVFEYLGYRGRGGLLGELFGMSRRYDSNYVLNRDGAYLNLPKPASDAYYYLHDLHFMGWITAEAVSP